MKRLYDYGVLMVHGIGESRRADTLVRFSEPLITRIQELLSQHTGEPPPEKVVSTADLYGEGAPSHAEVKFTGQRKAAASEPSTEHWLFAEAWWAESFPTPTYKEIASWATEIIPSTLVAHFDERFRRLGYRFYRLKGLREWGDWGVKWLGESIWLLIGLLLVPVLLTAVFLILIVGLIPLASVRDFVGKMQRTLSATLGDSYVFMGREISAASIVGKVERDFHWLSSRCRQVAVISHSQGAAVAHRALKNRALRPEDLFVTLGSGLRKLAEIERVKGNQNYKRVRRAIRWASGFALASAAGVFWITALGEDELARRFLVAGLAVLATIVSGTLLIGLQQLALRSPGGEPAEPNNRAWLIGYLAFWGVAAWRLGPSSWPDSAWQGAASTFLVAGGLSTAFTFLMEWRRYSDRYTHSDRQEESEKNRWKEAYRFDTKNVEWWNLYAKDDPVSNGPLLDAHRPRHLLERQIRNFDSVLSDHTSYWANRDGFVTPLARALLSRRPEEFTTPAAPTSGPRNQRPRWTAAWTSDEDSVAAVRRTWRVRWLVWARRTLAVLAFAMFLFATAQANPWSQSAIELLEGEENGATLGESAASGPVTLLQVLLGDATFKDYVLTGASEHEVRTAAVLALLYWLIAYGLVVLAWGYWNSAETRGLGRFPFMSWRLSLFLLTLAAASGGAFAVALGDWAWLASGAGVVGAWTILLLHHGVFGTVAEATEAQVKARTDRIGKFGRDSIQTGWQLFDDGFREKAVEVWKRAMVEEDSAEGAYLVSRYLVGDTDEAAAERLAATQYAAEREHPSATADLGFHYSEQEDWLRATLHFEKALDYGAEWVAISLARALRRAGRDDEARALLNTELEKGDGYAAHVLGEEILEAERDKQHKQRPDSQNLDRAAKLLQQAIQLGNSDSALSLGEVYKLLDDVRRARQAFIEGADLGVAGCYWALGRLELEREQDPDAAFIAFETEHDRDPEGLFAAEALLAMGKIQEEREKLVSAQGYYRTASWHEEYPSGEAACALGKLYEAQYDFDRARASFERAVAIDAWGGPAELLAFLVRSGEDVEALEKLRHVPAPEHKRKWAEAAMQVGKTLVERHAPDKAIEAYKRAVALEAYGAKRAVLEQLVETHKDDEALEWLRNMRSELEHCGHIIHELAQHFLLDEAVRAELWTLAAEDGQVESVSALVGMVLSRADAEAFLTRWVTEHSDRKDSLQLHLTLEKLERYAEFVAQLAVSEPPEPLS